MGAVLLLALAITVYAQVVTTDVPRWGADAERAWDQELGRAADRLARGAIDRIAGGSSIEARVARPVEPRALDVPIIGRTAPPAPTGAVTFEPSCSSVDVRHTPHGKSVITDLAQGARGCIVFQSAGLYVPDSGWRLEAGGLVRLAGDRGYVATGPGLDLDASASPYRFGMSMPGFSGPAATASLAPAGGGVRLDPVHAAPEVASVANAGRVEVDVQTAQPLAWKTWYDDQLRRAGYLASRASPGAGESAADFTVTCDPVDCTVGAGGLGTVRIVVEGPRTDRDDIRFGLAYALFRTDLG